MRHIVLTTGQREKQARRESKSNHQESNSEEQPKTNVNAVRGLANILPITICRWLKRGKLIKQINIDDWTSVAMEKLR